MTYSLLIERDLFQTRACLLQGDTLIDYLLEPAHHQSRKGQIIKGRILKLDDALNAAFVDLGQNQSGLLPRKAIRGDKSSSLRDFFTEGQRLLVQIQKDPVDGKPAELTTFLELQTPTLIYRPLGSGIIFPGKWKDADKKAALTKRVSDLPGEFRPRSRAEAEPLEVTFAAAKALHDQWQDIKSREGTAKKTVTLYTPPPQAASLAQHLPPGEELEVLSNDPKLIAAAKSLYGEDTPSEIWARRESLLAHHGLEDTLTSLTEKQIALTGGGNITVEQTEALVAIDVNSGTSDMGGGATEGPLSLNLVAAKEIARQIRLRNLSGILIIDFLRLQEKEARQALNDALSRYIVDDPATVRLIGFTSLGLFEMTRQRTRPSLAHLLSLPAVPGAPEVSLRRASKLVTDFRQQLDAGQGARLTFTYGPAWQRFWKITSSEISSHLGCHITGVAAKETGPWDYDISPA
ncbi:ribonuclease E/G [Sneathiella limimaris]|uniref:ribonuclease E/G n=1 Tax=Sneathiella limimaris TaxID=1964213 RepID=UPI00146C7E9B|nr:ribonuclease E/G [Sneathiella limimaris]